MTGYRVDPEDLRRGDAGVAESAAQARTALERLRVGADSLFADGWHGPAAAAFRHSWQQWQAGAAEIVSALDGMAARLGAAGDGYADAETGMRAAIAAVAR